MLSRKIFPKCGVNSYQSYHSLASTTRPLRIVFQPPRPRPPPLLASSCRARLWPPRRMLQQEAPDYYSILGVPRHADLPQIKLAYFNMAKKFHPDTNPQLDARQVFALIAEAYDVLRYSAIASLMIYCDLLSATRPGVLGMTRPGWGRRGSGAARTGRGGRARTARRAASRCTSASSGTSEASSRRTMRRGTGRCTRTTPRPTTARTPPRSTSPISASSR